MNDFLKKNIEEIDGILQLKLNNSIVKKVSEFYTSNPFPNYKIDDDKISILEKGNKNLLANQFKKFVGHNKKILEIGCGTGQLSTYFSIGNNNLVVAMDATLQSLKIAKNFAKKNDIQNLIYVNADIFDDVLSKNYSQQSLETFIQGDMLEGENQFYVEEFDRKVDALRRTVFKVPSSLFFSSRGSSSCGDTIPWHALNRRSCLPCWRCT